MQAAPKIAPPVPESMTYSRYLQLEELLRCQRPLTDCHDEPLFIIIHQASELWMKLCLHELGAARECIRADAVRPALKMLARVVAAAAQLGQSWAVLHTMTPTDYMRFRGALGSSSGFQSHQYRLIEFLLGNKSAAHAARHADDPSAHARLLEELAAPGLYDEVLRLLHRRGFAIPHTHLERDFSRPYAASPEVEAAWQAIYADTEAHWDLYELAEKLVDLEERLQQWRFGHLRTVERVIGHKRGTGGTPGVPYLARVLEHCFFPELFSVRTAL